MVFLQWTPNAGTQQSGSTSSYSSSQQNGTPQYSGATSQVCFPLCISCLSSRRLHSPVETLLMFPMGSSCKTSRLSAARLQTTQASGISNAPQWPSNDMVQLADGRWVPAAQAPQQAPPAPADLSQGTGKASPYGVSASSQGESMGKAPFLSMRITPVLLAASPACLAQNHAQSSHACSALTSQIRALQVTTQHVYWHAIWTAS